MMQAYLTGIGWVTADGHGWGGNGDQFALSTGTLSPLARKDVFPEPNQRFGRMSAYAKVGLAALAFALRDAGLESWSEKRPVGVVASTLMGCLDTDLEYHKTVLLEGGGLASPNLFAYTLANCFLGDAAIQFGLTGSLLAINETGVERTAALTYALEEIALGEAETMVAGICDINAPELLGETLAPGAVFLVLSGTPPLSGTGYGTLSLSAGDRLIYNGTPAATLEQLVRGALAARTVSPRPNDAEGPCAAEGAH